MGADLGQLMQGFASVASLPNLAICLLGVLLGMASGVLPGIGPAALIAMLLPLTFFLTPLTSIIFLASAYNGAQQGAATAAILASSNEGIATGGPSTDGRRMAWQGQAGRAIGVSAISSLVAATIASFAVVGLAPAISSLGLTFGPVEFFSALILTLAVALLLSRGAIVTSMGMVLLGLLLGLVGIDVHTGELRMTLGLSGLMDGIGVLVVAIGSFAIGETIATIERNDKRGVVIKQLSGLVPTLRDVAGSLPSMLRGSLFGSVIGLLPGAGPSLASYASYEIERRFTKHGKSIGEGVVQGVAAPAAANKAGLQTSFIPMLTLGIPSNAAMALLLVGLTVHGIVSGPLVMTQQPQLFWGLIAAVWIGSVFVVLFNLVLVRGWIKLLEVPYQFIYPSILGFCALSVYSTSNSVFDVFVMCVFGVLGYFFKKLRCDPTPMLIAFVVAPQLEQQLRKSLVLANGDYSTFFTKPLSAVMLMLAAAVLLIFPFYWGSRERYSED